MKKISFFSLRVMLAVALCCFSFRAMADVVTLYDGTESSAYVPVYGYYADDEQRSQTLYSADDLAAAGIEAGATISSVTYYLSSPASEAWTSLWDVKIVETTVASLSNDFVSLTDATEVLTGATWSATKSEFVVEFTTPYVYQGGNLVINIQNQSGGNYKSSSFFGMNVSGASRYGYSYNLDSGSPLNFAPKTTFNYTASVSTCPRPESISVADITASSANVTWEGTASSYELIVNGVSTIETATSKQLTLAPFTRYNVGVRAICAEGDTSMVRSISFVTEKTCLAPDTVYFTEPTLDGNTTLTWGGDASMYYLLVADGGELLFNDRIGTNTFDITGLSSGEHNFIVYLSAQCGPHAYEQSDTLMLEITVDVPCLPAQLPWSEGFENMPLGNSSSAAPSCWSLLNANEGSYPYVYINNYDSYVYSGSKSLYFQSSNSVDAFAILPVFDVNLAGAEVSFWYRNEGTYASNGTLGIGYLTDPNDEASFVSIQDCEKTTTFTQVVATVPADMPADARLAFRYAHGSSSNYYAAVDDIEIVAASSCPKVQNIRLGEVSQTEAIILWSPAEGASDYNVLVLSYNDTLVNQNVQDTVLTVQNLLPSTGYSFSVAVTTVCSATEMSAAKTETLDFSTACGPIAQLPWAEDFESMPIGNSSSLAPTCWDFANVNEGTYPYVYVNNSYSYVHSGSHSLYFQSSNAKYAYVFLPEFSADLRNAEINFWYKDENANYSGYLDLGYMREGEFISIASYARSTTWTEATTALSELPAGERLCFQYGGASQNYYLGIDDIVIRQVPTCIRTTDITVEAVGLDSAVLVWPAVEGAQAYRVRVDNGDWTEVTDTTYVLSGLTPSTIYEIAVSVVTVCSAEDESEAFSKVVTFSTELAPLSAPYSESFDNLYSGVPAGWDNTQGTTTSDSYKFTSYSSGYLGRGIRFDSYYNSNGNTNTLVSPAVLIPETGYVLSFYVKNPTGGNYSASLLSGGKTTVLDADMTDISEWTQKSFSLDEYVGDSVQLVLEGTSNYGYDDAYLYFDELAIEKAPTCFPASDLRVDTVGTDFATLVWSPADSEQGYNIVVSQWGDTLANAYVEDTVFTLTGLRHSYPYYHVQVDITSVCGEDDLAKTYSSYIYFTTECGVNEIEYYTPFRVWFDGSDFNSNCFHTSGTGNSEGWQVGKGEVDLGGFSNYYATVPYATDTVRVTSVLELPLIGLRAGKQYEINFWAKGTDYQTEDTIAVYANEELIMAANAQEIGGAWVNIVDTIAGEGAYLISIRYSSLFGYSFSIDDLYIHELYQFEASTFEDLQVDENGIFRPYDKSGWNNWISGSQEFATYVDDSYGTPYYSDVTVSSLKDTTFTNDFSAGYDMKSACGTAAEGNQYAVWYNNWYSEGISVYFRQPEVVSGMYVTNNTYVVNSILNGDSYAKKFTTGDWFKLTVNGYVDGINETTGDWEKQLVGSVDFYLADFRNPVDYKYASDWMWLDLTSLGEVTLLGFELSSSDTGDWGMNTPAYFCFDNLGGEAPAQSADYRHITNFPENLWIIGECATANWNPSASKQMTKVADGVFEVIETLTGTWFAFSGSNSSNWDEVNALRFGANPSGATVTLGQAEAITGVAGDYCFTVPAAGTYKFVVDLNAMTVTVTTASGLENVDTDNVAEKFFRDNQVLIRKNGKVHNVLGQQVR